MPTPDERHANRLSQHILPSASSMIGICMTLVGLIKILESGSEPRWADECIAVIACVFFSCSVLSWFAIRVAERPTVSRRLERVADTLFTLGLVGIVSVGLLFAFDRL